MAQRYNWQSQEGTERGTGQDELVCRAEDLKGVLQQLIDQIADVDRRQSATLQDMQGRLARMGGQSEAVKAGLPRHLASAFERIEAGMTDLAERISETERERRTGLDAHQATLVLATVDAVPNVVATPATPVSQPTPVAPQMPDETLHPAEQPWPRPPVPAMPRIFEPTPAETVHFAAPMTQSSPGQDVTSDAASAALAAAVSVATRVEPEPQVAATVAVPPAASPGVFVQNPDEPWDQASANELARLYESDEPGLPPRHDGIAIHAPSVAQFVAAPQPVASPPVAEAAPVQTIAMPAHDPHDRVWLEARLSDIATRVEDQLRDLRPDASIEALGQRFDTFEQRFTSALDGIAMRSDVDGLRIVEAHILELAGEIDQTRRELNRLTTIETQLTELRRSFSDEEILRVLGSVVPTEDDLVRFAEEAATRVAERMTSAPLQAVGESPERTQHAAEALSLVSKEMQVAQATSTRQMTAIQDLLTTLMDERRRGEAQTTEALDTMQQAMQHVMERVDAMEAARIELLSRPAPVVQHAVPVAPTQTAAAAQQSTERFGAEPPPAHHRSIAEDAKAAARMAASAATAVRTQRAAAASEERIEPKFEGGAGDTVPTRATAPRPPQQGQPAAARPSANPALAAAKSGDRQSLIAMARRAAEQAKTEAVAKEAADTPAAGKAASLKERLIGKAEGQSEAGNKAAGKSGVLLVASLGLFLFAGYWLSSNPKVRAMMFGAGGTSADSGQPSEPMRIKLGPKKGSSPARESEPAAPAAPQQPAGEPSGGTKKGPDLGSVPAIPDHTLAMPGGPDVEQRKFGIVIETGATPSTVETVMEARRTAHLASLSQRTAHEAMRTSTVPATAVPGGMPGVAPTSDAAPEAPIVQPASASMPVQASAKPERQTLELPSAGVGPMSLRLAAAKGDPSAQFDVGVRLAEARGLPQDYEQAAVWFQRAAAQGHTQSQYRLAALYERGLGVKGDPARARAWYKRAAEQGNLKAMHNLAVMSAGGSGQALDYVTAIDWFVAAADHGLADSQFNLAVLHESGLGTAKDPGVAYKWYQLAARSGDKEAIRRRDLLKSKLEPEIVAAIEAEVAQWKPRPSNSLANDPRFAGEAWKRQASGN